MTDLAHVTQLLQDVAHHEQLGLPGLRDWLRKQREERSGATERNRRLDSDATAVQVMTVYAAKGLQFPVVYVPFAFNRNVQDYDMVVFHDDEVRCLYVGGKNGPGVAAAKQQGRREEASDVSRLSYVAMTRAQSQVVAWWAPAYDEPNGGLSRLLRGRRPGEAQRARPMRSPKDFRRRRDGAVPGVGVRGRSGDRSVGGRRRSPGAGQAGAVGPGDAALPPQHRHRVAAHLVLGSDSGGRDGRGHQRAGGHRTG